jgi:hypothetical protein
LVGSIIGTDGVFPLTEGHLVVDDFNIIVVRSDRELVEGGGSPLRDQYDMVAKLHEFLRLVTGTLHVEKRLLATMVDADVAASQALEAYKTYLRNNFLFNPTRRQ